MTNKEFVQKAEEILALKTIYLHGAFGAPLTEKNKQRYLKSDSINLARSKQINACSSDVFGFDCCGLVKAIAWGFSADNTKTYGGATYKANDFPDVSADGMIKLCSDVTTNFSFIPLGALVYMRGHCGIYVGDGYVIEATTKWKGTVQKTVCVNHPEDAIGLTRKWVSWGKLPFVSYEKEESLINPLQVIIDGKMRVVEHNINIDSTNYPKLREISNLLGYDVYWDSEHKMPRLNKFITKEK